MPSGELRRKLRAHGHPLKPLVQVGKGGVTKGVLAQVAQALFDHELVKVRIGTECPVDRFEVTDALASQPGTQVVQLVGRVALVYKRHPVKPRFEGKTALERAAAGEADDRGGAAKPAPPKKNFGVAKHANQARAERAARGAKPARRRK